MEEVDHDQDLVEEDLQAMEVEIDTEMEVKAGMVIWMVPEVKTEEEEWECKETSATELPQKKLVVVVVKINHKTWVVTDPRETMTIVTVGKEWEGTEVVDLMEIQEIMVVSTGIVMMIEAEWTEDLVKEDSEEEMMEVSEEETGVVVISVIEEVDQMMVIVSNVVNLVIMLETAHRVVTLVTEEETEVVSEEVVVTEEKTMVDTEVVVIMMTTEENPENLEKQHHSVSKEVDIEVAMMDKVNTLPVEEAAAAA